MTDQLSTLASYVAPAVADAIYRHPKPPETPTVNHFKAAVLFADVSGFTPLAEALAQKGPEGAEELTRLLNSYFSRMITLIDAEGGEVVQFSGDAMTVVFPAEAGRRDQVAQRAWQTAQTMQAAMSEFAVLETIAGPVELGMKIGVGLGKVYAFSVGGEQDKWEYIIAGDPLRQVAEAEHAAKRGEIILSTEAQKPLRSPSNKETVSRGEETALHPLPPLSPSPLLWNTLSPAQQSAAETALHAYIPEIITGRLSAGQSGWIAELRRLTVLFVSVVEGLDYARPEALTRLQSFTAAAQSAVLRYEGSINKIAVDDKGTMMIGLFGAPPFAHEDDPERALRCALDLQAAAQDQSLRLAIGLTTGQVFSGPVGSDSRREYTVMGDIVNLAARLMSAAARALAHSTGSGQAHSTGSGQAQTPVENGIRCDHETYQAAAGRLIFDVLSPVQVKGKTGLIAVYRPVSAKKSRKRKTQKGLGKFVGRVEELTLLTQLLNDVCAEFPAATDSEASEATPPSDVERSRVVLIEGEAGIGKSRLLQETGKIIRQKKVIQLSGAGSSIEQNTAYRAWRDIFSAFFNLDELDSDDPNGRRQQVIERVRMTTPDLIERAPLLDDILGLGLPENELTRGLDPEMRHESLISFLIDLLRAWTKERPLVVTLEDAHWLDSSSWELAQEVARALQDRALLLIIALRPLRGEAANSEYLQLKQLPQTTSLPLAPLDAIEITDLVAARLEIPTLPPQIAELTQTRTGGNPFFAEELAHVLRDSGVIASKEVGGKTTYTVSGDLSQLALPNTVQGLVLSRLDQLSPEEYLTLKVASVVGRKFAYRILRPVYPTKITDRMLHLYLDDLAHLDLTPLETPETTIGAAAIDLNYYFKHIITQEVAYETLLFSQRRGLHRKVAEWYEREGDKGIRRQGDRETRGQREGEGETRRQGDKGTDLHSFGKPRTGSSSFILHPFKTPYLPLLVYHYRRAGDIERERRYARLAGEQAAAQFANSDAVGYLSRALKLLGTSNLSDPGQILAELKSEDLQRELFELLAAREVIYDRQGKREEQFADLDVMLAVAEAWDDDQHRLQVYNRLALYYEYTGDYPAGKSAAETALNIAQRAGNKRAEGENYNNLASIAWKEGKYKAARSWGKKALAVLEAVNDERGMSQSLKILGNICHDLGESEAALAYQQQALEINQATGDRWGEGAASLNLGNAVKAQGDWLTARDYYEHASNIFRNIGYRRGMAYALGSLGLVYYDLGDYPAAKNQYAQVLSILHIIGDRWGEGIGLHNMGRVYHKSGQDKLAQTHCEKALTIQRDLGDRRGEAFSLTYLALALEGLEAWGQAAETHQQALLLRREIGQQSMAVENLAGMARAALAQGHIAQALKHAQEILDRLNEAGIEGIEDPLSVYHSIYRVLAAAGQKEPAGAALSKAYALLMDRAGKIKDERWRNSFLENVPVNRQIISAWEMRQN